MNYYFFLTLLSSKDHRVIQKSMPKKASSSYSVFSQIAKISPGRELYNLRAAVSVSLAAYSSCPALFQTCKRNSLTNLVLISLFHIIAPVTGRLDSF